MCKNHDGTFPKYMGKYMLWIHYDFMILVVTVDICFHLGISVYFISTSQIVFKLI